MTPVASMARVARSGRFPFVLPRGPISRLRVGRTLLATGGIVAAGSLVAAATHTPALQSLGLGLAFPGGGFSLCGAGSTIPDVTAFWLGGASLAAFGVCVFLWFATGNVFAPPAVWLLSAVAASGYAHHRGCLSSDGAGLSILGLVLAAGLGAAAVKAMRPVSAGRPAGEGDAVPPAPLLPVPCLREPVASGDLDDDDLARLRFLLDRALQPLDRFDGFERLDAFQSAALRYQLQFSGYALALVQRHRLPGLQAYLTDAQANLIEKARDHRVWRYWLLESLWGRGRLDPDPIAVDNVMYAGFCATQIALFQAASGDRRFSRRGAFSLQHPSGRRFEADFPSLVAGLADQHARSAFGLIACEPNWLFPVCNSIGYVALAARDAQVDDDLWHRMAPRQEHMMRAEFRDARGRFVTCRSSLTGLAMPPVGGVLTQLLPSFFLNATLPDLARENWQRLRGELLRAGPGSDRVRLAAFWPIDVGNYRFTRIAGLSGAAATAAELGDREVADAMLEALDARHPISVAAGRGHRPRASIWSHAFELMARCGRSDGLRDLVRYPSSPGCVATTPHVAACPYPAALVAGARMRDDALDVTLVSGDGGAPISLGLGGLNPSRTYRRSDDASLFRSGPDGKATIEVALGAGRRRIRIAEAA